MMWKSTLSSVLLFFSHSFVSDSLQPHGLQHTRFPCPSFTISQSLLKLMSIESVMSSSHLINCHLLLLLPSIFPSIRVFFSESALHIRQPKYCCISPLRLFSGHSSPVLTLRTDDVAYASLPSPHLLLADVSF